MHPHVHSSTIHNSQHIEATQMSNDRWMDKKDVAHTHNRIPLSHKNEQNNAILDGHRDYHTKWSKLDRERQTPHDITYMWNLKMVKMILFIKQKKTHRHRKQLMVTEGEAGRDILGVWDYQTQTTIYKIDKQ